MDSVDPSAVATVQEVLEGTEGVERVEAVRLRWVGHDLWAEAEVVSDCQLSVAEAHEIAEEAHHRLLHQVAHLARATIHTSPCTHRGGDHHGSTSHHFLERP
jgi:divalent metal cation (Fe/Co/Zn/Cd) transporter